MRYLTSVLLLVLLLVGCQPTEESRRSHYDRETEFYGFDFTEYADQGFLITPYQYDGEYESVGILRVVIWPEMTRIAEKTMGDRVTEYSDWRAEEIQMDTAVDSLYDRAREMGADAIIDFQAERITEDINEGVRVGVEARGFAIDRD